MQVQEPQYDPPSLIAGALATFTRSKRLTKSGLHLESSCNDCDFRIRLDGEPLDEAERNHAGRCFGDQRD